MKELIKKYKKNFLLLFVISFIIYLIIIIRNDAASLSDKIKDFDLIYLPLILLLLLLYVFLEGVVIYILSKYTLKGISLMDCVRVNLATQFFNAITPFASGGQPFQVVYFHSRGIKVKDSTIIVVMNFITYSIAFVAVGLLCLIIKYPYFHVLLEGSGYRYLILVGISINIIVTLFTISLAFSKKLYYILIEVLWKKIIRWPILRRFHLDEKTSQFSKMILDYQVKISELKQNWFLWFMTILIHIIRVIIFAIIPLIIFQALGENLTGLWLNLIVASMFVDIIMSYVPTPGASGGAEGVFYLFFNLFFKTMVVPGLLLWRLITYYLYIVAGFIALVTLNYQNNLKDLNYDNVYDIEEENSFE